MSMKNPQHVGEYPERTDDCQAALKPKLDHLYDQAVDAGWPPTEIALAIDHILKERLFEIENARTMFERRKEKVL